MVELVSPLFVSEKDNSASVSSGRVFEFESHPSSDKTGGIAMLIFGGRS
jgi:hypothetical protein